MKKDDILKYINECQDKNILDELQLSITEQKRGINPSTSKKFIKALSKDIEGKIQSKVTSPILYKYFDSFLEKSINIAEDIASKTKLNKTTANSVIATIYVENDFFYENIEIINKVFGNRPHVQSTIIPFLYSIMEDKENNNINNLLGRLLTTAYFDKETIDNIKAIFIKKFDDPIKFLEYISDIEPKQELYNTGKKEYVKPMCESEYRETGDIYNTYKDLLNLGMVEKLMKMKDLLISLPTSKEYLRDTELLIDVKFEDKNFQYSMDLNTNIKEIEGDIATKVDIQLDDIDIS